MISNTATAPVIDIRRADDRLKTGISWLDSKHSFSFGHHYDPANTHHGLLLVNNDDTVRPGAGFETHPHRDMEIVTWVLRGSLVHQDSTGNSGVIYPGLAQRMSAGRGIMHSEKNDSWTLTGDETHSEPVHFVQMWVVPDEAGIAPGYQQTEIDDELLRGGLVTIASGMPEHRDKHGDKHPQPLRRTARRPTAGRPVRRTARSAVPAPVRTARRGHTRGRRHSARGRRGALHRLRRPAGHRRGAGRDPGLGDACGAGGLAGRRCGARNEPG